MKPFYALYASVFLSLAYALPAQAGNIANCEVVLMKTIPDESGNGGVQVASYRPAAEFIASVYNSDMDTLYEIDGEPIQAIMCRRMDIIPSETDFNLLATGIPFFVSQSFESADTDLISVFFKAGEFRYSYKGPGLSEETKSLLEERISAFNEREHDLYAKEAQKKEKAEEETVASEDPDLEEVSLAEEIIEEVFSVDPEHDKPMRKEEIVAESLLDEATLEEALDDTDVLKIEETRPGQKDTPNVGGLTDEEIALNSSSPISSTPNSYTNQTETPLEDETESD